jgi:hypothetical protein
VTAAPRNPLIADLSTLAAFGHALAGAVRAAVLAIVAQAVDASEADQALTTTQFATLLKVVWPGSASPIPPVASARRGRSSSGCRQRRRAIPGTRCSARRGLRALNRMVDLGPGGIYGPKHRQLAPLNCPMNLNKRAQRVIASTKGLDVTPDSGSSTRSR